MPHICVKEKRKGMQFPGLHSAEEMRQISNAAHIVEGVLVAVAATLALSEPALRRTGLGARAQIAWPLLIFLAGSFLSSYLLVPHHGISRAADQWSFVWNDPQQRQHLLISVAAMVGGAAELVVAWQMAFRKAASARILSFGWPAALLFVGFLFLTHPQHGTSVSVARAALIHRSLGALLLSASVVRIAEISSRKPKFLKIIWPVLLLIAGALLTVYREPEGAYEKHMDMPAIGSTR